MKRLNWKVILSNIQEARKELENLESQIASTKKPHEVESELSLRHAYHHLNTAWNARRIETNRYRRGIGDIPFYLSFAAFQSNRKERP